MSKKIGKGEVLSKEEGKVLENNPCEFVNGKDKKKGTYMRFNLYGKDFIPYVKLFKSLFPKNANIKVVRHIVLRCVVFSALNIDTFDNAQQTYDRETIKNALEVVGNKKFTVPVVKNDEKVVKVTRYVTDDGQAYILKDGKMYPIA